jgi:conjugative transfer pilus assembly protein TraH
MLNYCLIQRLIVFICFALCISNANAGLDEELKSIFANMSNVTPANNYQTSRRMGATGGTLEIRNPIYNNVQTFSFQAPSINVGCNGIDVHMGGFSMINAQEAINAMKAIMSNASGYAFSLALQAMCPTCGQEMQKIEAKINSFNKQFTNSCQAAKALVNNTKPGQAMLEASKNKGYLDKKAASASASLGAIQDPFEFLNLSGSSASANFLNDAAVNPTPQKTEIAEEMVQNSVWRAIKKTNMWQGFGASMGAGSDPVLFREQLMSLIGTVIIKQDPTTKNLKPEYIPPLLTVKDFLEGNQNGRQINIWVCDDPTGLDRCLNVTSVNTSATTPVSVIPGVKYAVRDMIFNGIYPKIYYRLNTAGATIFTPAEQAFLEQTTPGVTNIVRSMGANSSSGNAVLEMMADTYSLQMVQRFMDKAINAMYVSLTQANLAAPEEMMSYFEATKSQLQSDIAAESERIKAQIEVLNVASRIKENFQSRMSAK